MKRIESSMKIKRIFILALMISLILIPVMFLNRDVIGGSNKTGYSNPKMNSSDDVSNYNLIESIFENKLSEFDFNGSFLQYYEPSLQATYYALYILNELNQLNRINITEILHFIMKKYNPEENFFTDNYSDRYLATDFALSYYPLSTLLETNCYAYLSLDILNRTDLIDSEQFLTFIWSCYNPNQGAFMGRPYDPKLEEEFKIVTLDNSYFAVEVLKLLVQNWDLYSFQKTQIVTYINNAQSSGEYSFWFGGFMNDNDPSYNSLGENEPNLLSCFYAINILETFQALDTIRMSDLHQYLNASYHFDRDYFEFGAFSKFPGYANIIGSSLGLELAKKTNLEDIDLENSFSFILENRNELGIWPQSTEFKSSQLIDTYQVIRSLSNSGFLSNLGKNIKNEIASGISIFSTYQSYSFMPKTTLLLSTLYSTISSFNLNNRIFDLDIQRLYNMIEKSYLKDDPEIDLPNIFFASIGYQELSASYRLRPIEMFNLGNIKNTEFSNYVASPKNTYMALKSLQYLFNLDNFATVNNLINILNSLIASQFLNETSDFCGGFLPYEIFNNQYYSNSASKTVIFENAYYAIKSMKIIIEHLELGSLENITFSKEKLYNYIKRNIIKTQNYIYYQPRFTNSSEIILEYTYYMIDLLKDLNLYGLDSLKIQNYVLNSLDYSNVKNLYYSYKISEMLNLNIEFDEDETYSLVNQLYDENSKEFRQDIDSERIDQNAFNYIVELGNISPLTINSIFSNPIYLGDTLTLQTTFQNLILKDFGSSSMVVLESAFMGDAKFEKNLDNCYQISFPIPCEPEYFPFTNAEIKVYVRGKLYGQTEINIETQLNEELSYEISKTKNSLSTAINYSRRTSLGYISTENCRIYADISNGTHFLRSVSLEQNELDTYSEYYLNETFDYDGFYNFKIYLEDEFYPELKLLFKANITVSTSDYNPIEKVIFDISGPVLAFLSLTATALTVGIIYKTGNWIKLRRYKKIFKKNSKSEQFKDQTTQIKEDSIKKANLFEEWSKN